MSQAKLRIFYFILILFTIAIFRRPSLHQGEEEEHLDENLFIEQEGEIFKPTLLVLNSTQSIEKSLSLPKLFIGVLSACGKKFAQERDAIRNTWGKDVEKLRPQFQVDMKFFIGNCESVTDKTRLETTEKKRYNDMILLDLPDKYEEIWRKTIAIMQYGVDTFQADYVLKVDNDVYINLTEFIRHARPRLSADVIACRGKTKTNPVRDKNHKWYISPEEFPGDKLPSYPVGFAYLMGKNIANFVAKAAPTLKHYRIDDVGVGIWLNEGEKMGVIKPKFANLPKISAKCKSDEGLIVIHALNARNLICIWKNLNGILQTGCCGSKKELAE